MEAIARTLQKLASSPERQEHWPEILFIQVDGSVGDNKNRVLLGYCAWLVAQGYFKEVHLNFLLVGEHVNVYLVIIIYVYMQVTHTRTSMPSLELFPNSSKGANKLSLLWWTWRNVCSKLSRKTDMGKQCGTTAWLDSMFTNVGLMQHTKSNTCAALIIGANSS